MTKLKSFIVIGLTFTTMLSLAACRGKVVTPHPTTETDVSMISTSVAAPMQHMRLITGAPQINTENYKYIKENGFKSALTSPLSTFSIDVDTASYSNVRRMLRHDQFPQPGAVRIEELINYFNYDYPSPDGDNPVAFYQELTYCPWNPSHQLLHLGLQAKTIDVSNAVQSNLVFLLDVSGSMSADLKLVKNSLKLLVAQMDKKDKISIVVYAGAAGVILEPTSAKNRQVIESALDKLEAGGSTAGGEGIELAYQLAERHLINGGNNRIILATDGDFNVGQTSEDALVRLIEKKRDAGISLTILGFGMLNYDDVTAEALADHGNGNYSYIDNILEAKKVLVDQIGGTMFTVAKDVKLQVEFNPSKVKSYRLIGYENRLLANEDFANDQKDSGDMGAGHTVTALYEIIPTDTADGNEGELRYQKPTTTPEATTTNELALVNYRYKKTGTESSELLSTTIIASPISFNNASENQRFASSVAAWGMQLRGSEHKGSITWDWIINTARQAKGLDSNETRAEFVRLVERSKLLSATE